MLNDVLVGLAIAAFVAFVTFLLSAHQWMHAVKENHLAHIQKGVERTADAADNTNTKLAELAIREEARHAAQLQALADLKDHIRIYHTGLG